MASGRDQTPLLQAQRSDVDGFSDAQRRKLSRRVLLLPLFAAVGMSSVVASIISAYAYLCCANPLRCNEHEKQLFSSTIALGTTIENICGIVILGLIAHISKNRRGLGLTIWFLCRGTSVALVVLATVYKSIPILLVGRIFEGAASDNILHFNLNSFYVETTKEIDSPELLCLSLALFMIGSTIGPPATSFFNDFRYNFYFALVIFTSSVIYLRIGIPWKFYYRLQERASARTFIHIEHSNRERESNRKRNLGTLTSLSALFSFYGRKPFALWHGIALLSFTAGQAYFFSALMVLTSTKFKFTSQQNGWLVMIISSITGAYILVLALGISRSRIPSNLVAFSRRVNRPLTWDYIAALVSMVSLSVALGFLSVLEERRHVYVVVVFAALGNAAPPLVKSHLNSFVEGALKTDAMAALAFCETLGSIASPVIVGAVQSFGISRSGLPFFVASSFVALSAIFFMCSIFHRNGGRN